MWSARSRFSFKPLLQAVGDPCEAKGVKAFGYTEDIRLGSMKIMADTIRLITYIQCLFLE